MTSCSMIQLVWRAREADSLIDSDRTLANDGRSLCSKQDQLSISNGGAVKIQSKQIGVHDIFNRSFSLHGSIHCRVGLGQTLPFQLLLVTKLTSR